MPIREKKELSLSYLLWCLSFVGVCGVQRMYLGQVGYGMVLLFTLGLCGIGQLLDLFLLPDSVKQANRGLTTADPAHDAAAVSTHHAAPFSPAAGNSQAEDGELDQLLRAAQESVKRTQQQFGE